MIVEKGQSRFERYTSGTFDGIYLNAYMVAAALNTPLVNGDLTMSQIAVKVVLKRKKQTYILMQDNLQLLGTFATLGNNYHEFTNGIDKVYPAADAKAVKVRLVKLDFGGHIRLTGKDELLVEISLPQVGWISVNVDDISSYIEFNAVPSIGYETHLPFTKFEVVQANANKLAFNPGDNITKMMFLNFDQNDLQAEIISNLSISSDKYDINLSFNQLLAHHLSMFDGQGSLRYGTALPISLAAPTIRRGLDYLPQSFMLFHGDRIAAELDQCRVDISFNRDNVATSQNYLGYRTYEADIQTVQNAITRNAKHMDEKLTKIATPAK
ncbi:MAG: hypothetical protein ABIQ31_17895 [Ferruginibacter sp.]